MYGAMASRTIALEYPFLILAVPRQRERERDQSVIEKGHADLHAVRHAVSVVVSQQGRQNRFVRRHVEAASSGCPGRSTRRAARSLLGAIHAAAQDALYAVLQLATSARTRGGCGEPGTARRRLAERRSRHRRT